MGDALNINACLRARSGVQKPGVNLSKLEWGSLLGQIYVFRGGRLAQNVFPRYSTAQESSRNGRRASRLWVQEETKSIWTSRKKMGELGEVLEGRREDVLL